MQKPRIAAHIVLACICSLVVAMFALIAPKISAQTITINPPQYPNLALPFPDLYLNSAKNWQYMAGALNSGPNATFLPSTPLTRVVGNVHWVNIQPGYNAANPVTEPDVNQPTWSNTLAGIGAGLPSDCAPPYAPPYTSGDWWPAAQCFPSNGNTTADPNNIIYTFYTVPLWASAANATHLSTTYPNTYDGWNVTDASGYTITLTGTGGPPNVAVGDNIALTGNSYGTSAQVTVAPTVNGNTETLTLSSYQHPTQPDNAGYVTFTTSHPPSDVYSGATCTLPDGSTSPKGDCFFKSYVTYMMMHTCGDLTKMPSSPLSHACAIHYWEGWNEFGEDQFWNGTYTRLAFMMVDADVIIHEYCADCFFIAGSTSAGGDAGHYINPASKQGNDAAPDSSGVYLEGLGQLLRDWANVASQLTTKYKDIKPDAVSVHPYWGYDEFSPEPMPESNVAPSWDPDMMLNGKLAYPGLLTCTGSAQIEDNQGKEHTVTTPPGCVNICVMNYQTDPEGNTHGTVVNLNPNAGGCTSYVANPVASTPYGTRGTPSTGCNIERTTPTQYATRDNWIEPTDTNNQPLQACRDSFINAIKAVQQLIPAVDGDSEVIGYVGANWLPDNIPIWNTESSWGKFSDTAFTGMVPQTKTVDPKDGSLSTFVQQAYIARMSILAAQAGTSVNLWYQWDEDTRSPNTVTINKQTVDVCTPWLSNWGNLGYDFPENYNQNLYPTSFNPAPPPNDNFNCPDSDINDLNGPKVERAGYTFNRVFHWLEGKTFVSPGCTGNSDGIWTCEISGSGGYEGLLVWYTPFDQGYSYALPSNLDGLSCLKDIDGNLLANRTTAHIYNRPALFDNTPAASCTGTDPWPK